MGGGQKKQRPAMINELYFRVKYEDQYELYSFFIVKMILTYSIRTELREMV